MKGQEQFKRIMVKLRKVSIHISKNPYLLESIQMYLEVPQSSMVHRILQGKEQGLRQAPIYIKHW